MFKRSLLPAAFMWLAPLVLVAQGWQHMGAVQKVEKLPDGLELTSGKAKVRLTVFRWSVPSSRGAERNVSQGFFVGGSRNSASAGGKSG